MYTFSGSTTIRSADVNSNFTEVMHHMETIVPFISSTASSAWSTLVVSTSALMCGYRRTDGTINAYIEFPVLLSPGTWTITFLTTTDTDRGIYTVTLDGTSVGTVDGYAASNNHNVELSITGISVATGGRKLLRLTMATKNASSSAYYGYLSILVCKRTA